VTPSWRLHVPRTQKERALRLCKAGDELHQQLGRSPTTSELAEQLEVGEAEVLEGLAAASSRREVSLDQPVGEDAGACVGYLVATPKPGKSQKTYWP
jgi:RNA polymerase sigma-B factor